MRRRESESERERGVNKKRQREKSKTRKENEFLRRLLFVWLVVGWLFGGAVWKEWVKIVRSFTHTHAHTHTHTVGRGRSLTAQIHFSWLVVVLTHSLGRWSVEKEQLGVGTDETDRQKTNARAAAREEKTRDYNNRQTNQQQGRKHTHMHMHITVDNKTCPFYYLVPEVGGVPPLPPDDGGVLPVAALPVAADAFASRFRLMA